MFDYDLVIIGGTLAAIEAATTAANLQARVALVEPPRQVEAFSMAIANPDPTTKYRSPVPPLPNVPLPTDRKQLANALEWAAAAIATVAEEHSPAVLAALGIDVIASSGQFVSLPQLAFEVNTRKLFSRTYLLAPQEQSVIPNIPGLEDTDYLTRETLYHLTTKPLPESAVVLGNDPSGIELAQTLVRLGIRVTLVVSASRILPKEDPEAARLIQAQLEAQGIRVLTEKQVTQVQHKEGKKSVQVSNEAIAADEIILAYGFGSNLESLNLEVAGVKCHETSLGRRVQLNKKLQTTNPRIYACGNLVGGYPLVNIAQYEARIAVKNALFWPIHTVDYRNIPWAFNTFPQLARVGLTEPQARRRYEDVLVLREYFKNIAGAQLCGETTGFCKILVRRSGEILGAHIVGPEASELIHTFALAMQNKLKVEAIAKVPPIWPSLSEINGETAQQWKQQRLTHNEFWQTLRELFFNSRR